MINSKYFEIFEGLTDSKSTSNKHIMLHIILIEPWGMANVPELLRCYRNLQRARYSPEILKKITAGGRITISLGEFLSYGDIFDEISLNLYDVFIRRDPSATGFRNLVDIGWDRNCRDSNRNFVFVLTADAACLQQLGPLELVQHTPATKASSAVTPDLGNENDIMLPANGPSRKRSRISSKKDYSPATLAKYSKAIESKLILLLKNEIPSANEDLQNQVLKDVMLRLENRFCDSKADCNVNEVIVSNIKALVNSINKYGLNDREQIRFKENLALAISGSISFAKLTDATSLSRRVLEHGREMRTVFDNETIKAVAEEGEEHVDIHDDDNSEADSENESDDDHDFDDDIDNDDINEDNENSGTGSVDNIPKRKKRAHNGEIRISKNRYRRYISSRSRKVRSDAISGEEIQRFCHESQWGGRIDTLKLAKQSVIVNQPGGGCEYEPVRSYQYTVREMYTHFKGSEYGARQRNSNSGRNLSMRRFRELICPCMTNAKQRDTADQIVAEFKQCLRTWDLMRGKDQNVKASILRCSSTECPFHANSSSKTPLYAAASRTATDFLHYLLCSKINRNELAVHIPDSSTEYETFESKRDKQMKINLAAAEAKKVLENETFNATCSRKGAKVTTVY